jgi:hypothetical protein
MLSINLINFNQNKKTSSQNFTGKYKITYSNISEIAFSLGEKLFKHQFKSQVKLYPNYAHKTLQIECPPGIDGNIKMILAEIKKEQPAINWEELKQKTGI